MKKLFSIILALALTSGMAVSAADVDAGHSAVSNIMSIRGDAGKYNAGNDITLLLLESGADAKAYTYDQIGYVEQGEVAADGTYDFNFKFTGNVGDYKLLMNLAGENVTNTVSSATSKMDLFDIDLKINKLADTAEAVAQIENRYQISGQAYKIVLSFYDKDNKLLGAYVGESGTIADDVTNDTLSKAMPADTAFIKAMLWDDTESMIPLCEAETRGDERIVCWGDSLTEGAGGGGVTYGTVLAELTGREVVNKGIGGQTATQIAVRQGGIKLYASEFTIPADTTPVEISITTSNAISISSMGLSTCYIDDIEGSLTTSVETVGEEKIVHYYFARKTAGKAYNVPEGTQIVSGDSLIYNDGIAVIWIGTNGGWARPGIGTDWFDFAGYIDIVDSMIAELTEKNEEYVVIGLTTPDGDGTIRAEMEEIVSAKYGDRFINMREYLTSSEDIYTQSGIELTDADKTNISNGFVPACIRTDGVHFNANGYQLIGEKIYDHMVSIGIIK